jgi:hypothetical protein
MSDVSATNDPATREAPGLRVTAAAWLEKILREKEVLKSGDSLDPAAIAKLAFNLADLRMQIELRKPAMQLEKERQRKIRDALDVLIELLPDARKDREKQEPSTLATHWPQGPTVEDAIATIDTLNSAAVYARVHMLFGPGLLTFCPFTEEWEDSAKRLDKLFNTILGKQSKDATYRFVEAVVPYLTGENPSYDAVRSAFMRGRLVDRGKSRRPLPLGQV